MPDAVLGILPMAIGAAIVPGWTILMLIVLERRDAVRAGSFLLGGVLLARLLQGVAFGWLFSSVSGGDHGDTGTLVSLTKLIVGVLMLVSAVRTFSRIPDHDSPSSAVFERAKSVSPWALAGAGVFLVLVGTRQWIFAIGAVGVASGAGWGAVQQGLLYVFYVVASSLPLIVPLWMAVAGGEAARHDLGDASRWLQHHERTIIAVVSAVLGAFFLVQGVRELT